MRIGLEDEDMATSLEAPGIGIGGGERRVEILHQADPADEGVVAVQEDEADVVAGDAGR